MSNILILNQKINQLMSMMDKLQTKITTTTTTTLIMTGNNVNINFKNLAYLSLSLNMTNNISGFTFQNPVINGNYKIYMNATSPFVMNKNLGTTMKNNLKGNTMILGYWCINVFYNGTIYFLDFNNYT